MMSGDDYAIRVAGVAKCYHIYERPQDRLRQAVAPRLARLLRQPARNYYREFWALRDVVFTVGHNETVGIVGRNGSGKSTLLQIICGTLAPTSGSVACQGQIAALLELGSGFNPEFTGRENIFMNGAVMGMAPEVIEDRFDAIVAFADIGDFLDQPVKTYSSGMAMRLAFAVAVNVRPRILVVDEALAVGDEMFQRKCFSRIEALKADGATILFVSHSGAAIVELCDRAILLDAGRVLADGSPRDVVAGYQKLLYAPAERQAAVRAELLAGSLPSANAPHAGAPSRLPTESAPYRDAAFFDPALVPLSTVAFESRGAWIDVPRILADDGMQVNCLRRGACYRYTYRVRFDAGSNQVRFAMLIKTGSGMPISGMYSAPGLAEAIPAVRGGTSFEVSFDFDCRLNPGVYFMNAGVLGTDQGEQVFLHRLVDACAFRVLPEAADGATEIANLCHGPAFHEI